MATASETPEQYRSRLAGYVGAGDFLKLQAEAPHALAQLIAGASEEKLQQRPAPDKWSVVEILAHLAEDELSSSWRYRQILEHDEPTLSGFDQEKWAALGDYPTWNSGEALEMFRLLREANLRMLRRLTPAQWERSGVHVERGRITVRELARHMAAHDINHIKQIEKLLT